MNIGERIKSLRREKCLTQSELAEQAGISRVALGNYERGDRQPTIEFAAQIADVLNISMDYLLGKTDDPTPLNQKSDWIPYEKTSKSFYEGFDTLTNEEKKEIESYMNYIIQKKKNDENK